MHVLSQHFSLIAFAAILIAAVLRRIICGPSLPRRRPGPARRGGDGAFDDHALISSMHGSQGTDGVGMASTVAAPFAGGACGTFDGGGASGDWSGSSSDSGGGCDSGGGGGDGGGGGGGD